ncbi:inorganic phosphate transporter [Sporolactobacillus spathodeae]|uniref:PiT family inorganic phosphate transporter n=1 Tax=Sporolactobacillus spathodeae TaxID=1465502 RepID=A0ABS2Q5N6_9BACL|nr:inorganic phosphate transporter [Sporolactobacillus spathodeae]MBM7656745.1 PiT family inorganic phosphate transporter [Sporolactobacillus spathodeae]
MDSLLVLTLMIVFFAFTFDFINGFHDTANTIATSVSTRAMRPRVAIILAGTMNFLGAITFTGVAQTISKGIIDPFTIHDETKGLIIVLAALITAIIWNLLTWLLGIPSSSSHAIIGSLAGAGISAMGFGALNYQGFLSIFEALIFSPIAAITLGFIIMKSFTYFFHNFSLVNTNRRFRVLQVFTAALQSFAHGTNDAQKTMGIITMALVASKYLDKVEIPIWVRVAAGLAMALGTSIGGWRIIHTVGSKIMKIEPINGAAADISSACIIFGFTLVHFPVSTTHVITSSILGVGSAERVRGVNWGVAINIVITWIITLPLTAASAFVIFKLLNLML